MYASTYTRVVRTKSQFLNLPGQKKILSEIHLQCLCQDDVVFVKSTEK